MSLLSCLLYLDLVQAKFTSFFGPGIKAEIGELCYFCSAL
jgi:hypothetical protein